MFLRQPAHDPRGYRAVVLPNGLKAMLVHDAAAEKAAAAATVAVGALADPGTHTHSLCVALSLSHRIPSHPIPSHLSSLSSISASLSLSLSRVSNAGLSVEHLPGLAHFLEHMLFLGTEVGTKWRCGCCRSEAPDAAVLA